MRLLTADYVFPISSPPIKNGTIVLDEHGFVLDVVKQTHRQLPTNDYLLPDTVHKRNSVERHRGVLCPGFVNAHCHLELSYLKGKISKGNGLPEFIGKIEKIRRAFSEKEIEKHIEKAEEEMLKNGIVAVGDISNSDFSFRQKSKRKIRYHSFIEALGFHPDKADASFAYCLQLLEKAKKYNLQASITPHAPYSASEKLLKKIAGFALKNNSIISIHNQENKDENKMFLEGGGGILERLNMLGIDISQWKPKGKTSLQWVFPQLPNNNKILLVHNTFTTKKDIIFLKPTHPQSPVHFCFCPNANLYIENALPRFHIFMETGCKITVGTDSLASNRQLSILDELKIISHFSPEISLNNLLTWATKNGAEFFNWQNELGSIEKGKKPGINLLKNIDLKNLKLLADTKVERVI